MKYIKQLQEFLEEELNDYSSFKYEIHFSDENKNYERYDVDIKQHDKDFSSVSFRLYENKIEIELGEGSWYETKTYDYHIKYFWMALLKWN